MRTRNQYRTPHSYKIIQDESCIKPKVQFLRPSMANARKPAKRRSGAANRRRKGGAKGVLSKTAKAEVKRIVHGEAETKHKSFDQRNSSLRTAYFTTSVLGNTYYAPTVRRIGGLTMAVGDTDYDRDGNEINMRSINFRVWFSLQNPVSAVTPNLSGPRRVLWWVVSLKPGIPHPFHQTLSDSNDLGSSTDSNDFANFFNNSKTGALGSTRHFDGSKYDEYDSVNTEVFTVHSRGKFDIGYSERPLFPDGTEGAIPGTGTVYKNQSFGNVPYKKDLRVPIPKFMLGKTKFVDKDQAQLPATAVSNKYCWWVCTSYPLTNITQDFNEVSGVLFDTRMEYKWTDI